MIDLLEPGDFESDVRNAARITITGKARINQKGFARWGHDERRGATLNVNEVDVERLWRGSHRWWKKAFLVIVLIPLLASTWFARQNHFEWMFHPLAHATFAKASEAGFVDNADIVMSVESNGEAAAYPIRLMAYHHVVQDVVGGTPIVATY